jgi:hypothetical protein
VPLDLSSVNSKIAWAKEHIARLQGEVAAYYNFKPYKIDTKRDPQTRKLIYYVSGIDAAPEQISHVAGDVVHALRSSLDALAYQLFIGGLFAANTPEDRVAFPISEDAAKYMTRLNGMVQGSRQDVVDAFRAVEAYKGGAGNALWTLNKLDNLNKHRKLIVANASAYRSVNIGAYFAGEPLGKEMADFMTKMTGTPFIMPVFEFYVRPAERSCPLQVGAVLLTDAPDAEVNEKLDFCFEVAFYESGVAEGEPLIETIHHFADIVHNTVAQFARFF